MPHGSAPALGAWVITVLAFGAWLAQAEPAHWEHCGWGGGGFYWSCAFHPARDGVIYLGGDVGGVYKTEDRGVRWRFINRGLKDYAVYSLAVDPSSPDTVYAGTVSGLCKSTDAGERWEFLAQTGPEALHITSVRDVSVRNLAVDPSDSAVVYAGTADGRIVKSTDGGASWQVLAQEPAWGSVSALAVSAAEPRHLVATSTGAGVLLSTDAGRTWATCATPKRALSVAIALSDADVLYAACGRDGVWRSADGGRTWSAATVGIRQNCVIRDVAVDPRNADRVFCIGAAGWDGFFYWSEDGGGSWHLANLMKRDLAADPTLPDEFAWVAGGSATLSNPANLALNPRNPAELFIAGNWRPCFSADAGRTWEERDRSADITCVTDIRFSGGNTYVTAMDEGLLVSGDGGATWRQLCPLKYDTALSGHQWRVLVWQLGDAQRILSTCSPWAEPPNRVLVSEDGGRSFRIIRDGLPDYRPTANTMWGQSYPRALAADPRNPRVLYLGMDGDAEPEAGRMGGGIFKSEDGGYSWRHLPAQPGSRRVFNALAVDPADPDRLYWGACGTGGGLYRSDDAGATWRRAFDAETWVFNVAVSPTGVVYCPGTNLWKSDDHGNTWTRLTEFGDSLAIVGLEVDPRDANTIWFSRVTWGSTAAGGSTARVTAGLPGMRSQATSLTASLRCCASTRPQTSCGPAAWGSSRSDTSASPSEGDGGNRHAAQDDGRDVARRASGGGLGGVRCRAGGRPQLREPGLRS